MKKESLYDLVYIILFFVLTYIVFSILFYGLKSNILNIILGHPITLGILFIISIFCLSLGIRYVSIYYGVMRVLGVALLFLGGVMILYVLSRLAIMFEHAIKGFLSWLH